MLVLADWLISLKTREIFTFLFKYVVLRFILTYTAPVWGIAAPSYTSLQHLKNKYLNYHGRLPQEHGIQT
jgi:hypothetical protein